MNRFLDCLVTYFGLDEEQHPTQRRYFCYHISAGPGPTAGSGVAAITALAIHDESERCTYCQNWHAVETGGPLAAIAAAIHYLDSYHENDRLRQVRSEIRGLGDTPAASAPLGQTAPFSGGLPPARRSGTSTRSL